MIKQRDLLLVPFPFSDQSGRKVRPVVVLSNDDFNDYSEDILIVGVTSNVSKGKYTISLLDNELDEGKLFSKCCIKVGNILKIDKELIIKKIGKVKVDKMDQIREKVVEIIG